LYLKFSGVQADSHGQLVGAQAEVHGRAAQRDDGFARFSKLLRLGLVNFINIFHALFSPIFWRQSLALQFFGARILAQKLLLK